MSVYFANEETDIPSRLLRVKDAVRNLVSSKIRVRVLYDLKQISLKQFTHCAEMFVGLKEELFKAYYDARRNKRKTTSQLRFELNLEDNIVGIYRELCSRRYVVGTSICFIINDSVHREVFAADFRDRVVHHFLNGQEKCYVLKLDLKGYFMNVDRMKLYGMIEASLQADFSQRDFVLWLTKEVVMNEPIINCRMKGNSSDWDGLPREKSLFYAAEENGMPIGNLTSQLFSNIYLNQFDHWMKRCMKCRHYGRYADDFYILHKSKEYLLSLLP